MSVRGIDGPTQVFDMTGSQSTSAGRVTPEELAEVRRMHALATSPELNVDARRTMIDQLANEAPRLAREVERLTAERDALAVRVTEMHGTIAQTSRNASAIIAAREALREKARAVCHARRFPATLQHAIDDLAAEVDKP